MANQITVTTNEIRNKADELSNANDRLKQDIGQLTEQEGALNGMWEGEAKDAFHNTFTNDIEKMNAFHTEMINYVQKLREIVDAYEKAEQTNANIARDRKR